MSPHVNGGEPRPPVDMSPHGEGDNRHEREGTQPAVELGTRFFISFHIFSRTSFHMTDYISQPLIEFLGPKGRPTATRTRLSKAGPAYRPGGDVIWDFLEISLLNLGPGLKDLN